MLTYWRTRLRSSSTRADFDAVRSVVDATGVLKGKTRRALDSTLLDDAVATQDTVTQLIAAIRGVRRVVPGAARVPLGPGLRHPGQAPHRLGRPLAKAELVDALVKDALSLLGLRSCPTDREAPQPSASWPRRRPRRRTGR